ncbi:hypothetical protein DYB28_013846, partial [Aphanomyces astaci]
ILIGVYNLAQHESQGVDASPSPSANLVRSPNLPPSIGSTAATSYLVDAYQTLLESHESQRMVDKCDELGKMEAENPNTYRPPALLRTL